MSPSRYLLVAGLLTMSAACSSSSHLGAAEPATAPATSAAPVGLVHAVGDLPEGIVYDATTDLVAVAVRDPARLLLLDPTTLTVRRTVGLPGTVRHLQLAGPGGPVLVPVESTGQLFEVNLPSGHTSSTPVGKQPHDATAAGGDVVVGNEFGKSISVIRDGAVIKNVGGLTQPGGVIGAGHSVVVVDVGAFTVSTYDLRTLARTASARAGAGPTHGVLVPGGRIAVADTRGGALLIFDVHPLKQVARLPLPGTPYGMAADLTSKTVWITLTARNQVVGVDVSGATPRVIARYPTVRQPNTVAVAPGGHTLWVTGTQAGVVERISR